MKKYILTKYIRRIFKAFWSYAREQLQKFHEVSGKYFEYYLKELEFRYNHCDEDLYTLIFNLHPLDECK